MVIRGATRGNGKQLAGYLLREAGNDNIQLLDVAGLDEGTEADLHNALFDMSVTAELSRSDKGLYHAQINPAPGEDGLSREQWMEAADMLGEQLGLAEQRRVIVLHQKKGRTHAHVVWERYDHEKKKLVSDSFSRLAQDRARQQMELHYGHKLTPRRNAHRPEMKQALTETWAKTESGADFIRAARLQGYVIAEGVPRRPYMVVDENGRSFDLTRQLKGVRIKEVRAKMRGESLIGEKEAIEQIRSAKTDNSDRGSSGKEKAKAAFKEQLRQAREGFAPNKGDMLQQPDEPKTKEQLAKDFAASRKDMLQPQQPDEARKRKSSLAQDFAANRDEAVKPKTRKEELKEQFLAEKRRIEERQQQDMEHQRQRGLDLD